MSSPDAMGIQAMLLDDGRRLHLQHGPIDLIIEADGPAAEVRAAYRQAGAAFESVLSDLVAELDLLRSETKRMKEQPSGPVAARMFTACQPYAVGFVTPMAAVAGAVADHILCHLTAGRKLTRAYVNNGGDIALFLGPDSDFNIAVCADPNSGKHAANLSLRSEDAIGGLATSGWQGRSHSLGIADAVTVLAETAAQADVAATLTANAVSIENCPAIERQPARELSPDSDLGTQMVTVAVGDLSQNEIRLALDAGEIYGQLLQRRGLIRAAYLNLRGCLRILEDRCAEPRLFQSTGANGANDAKPEELMYA